MSSALGHEVVRPVLVLLHAERLSAAALTEGSVCHCFEMTREDCGVASPVTSPIWRLSGPFVGAITVVITSSGLRHSYRSSEPDRRCRRWLVARAGAHPESGTSVSYRLPDSAGLRCAGTDQRRPL